jgi:hypothetical protein
MKTLLSFLALSSAALAQSPVAPSPDRAGSPLGDDVKNYNVVQSWELGDRWLTQAGSLDTYRSQVNFGNGIRLLSSSLTVNSRDGHGRWLDELVVTTQGLGHDPYESVVLRAQKNRLYDYNLSWRQNEYHNPDFVVALGEHFKDTERRWQDHELTLFPQAHYRFRAGYSRNVEDGPALTTEQAGARGAPGILPPALLFTDLRREYNTYFIGGDVDLAYLKATIQRRWDFYKEDSGYALDTTGLFGKTNSGPYSSFNEARPTHGVTPGWLLTLLSGKKRIRVQGRGTYSGGSNATTTHEFYTGVAAGPVLPQTQVIAFGTARRPVVTGNITATAFLTTKLTLVNTSSISNTRVDGNENFTQISTTNPTLTNTVSFQFLGVRLFTNSIDARYRFTKTFSSYAAYQYSDRLIRSIQSPGPIPGGFVQDGVLYSESNHLNAGILGFDWTPSKLFRAHVEGELGRNSNPFTPVAEKNYHAIDARLQHSYKKLQLTGAYREKYNNNSVSVTAFSSKNRNYSFSGTWNAHSWLALDAGYSRQHLDTAGGIAFYAGSPRSSLVTGLLSIFESNLHAVNAGMRFDVRGRLEIYLADSFTRDTGDGRGTNPIASGTAAAVFGSVQTFPLLYHSPSARASLRLRENLRINAGYQYYGYHEDFGLLGVQQNYRAHTGYSSLTYSF